MTHTLEIPIDGRQLSGDLVIPSNARGLVLFAHGSGSSRHSPRNRHVAVALQRQGLGTFLLDLLAPEEEQFDSHTALLRFDIEMLAERLVIAIDWLRGRHETAALPIGLFGASTGAAAALVAAAARPFDVAAIVSRGGRPDLAREALPRVVAPTLLIVGELDTTVIQLNRQAMAQMTTDVTLEVVPGATHLFEEPGALDRVTKLAAGWFAAYLD